MSGVLEYIEQEVGRQLVNTPIYQPAPDLVRSLMCFAEMRKPSPFHYRTADEFDSSKKARQEAGMQSAVERTAKKFVFVDSEGNPVSWL